MWKVKSFLYCYALVCFLLWPVAAQDRNLSTVQAALDNLTLASPLLTEARSMLQKQAAQSQTLKETLTQQDSERLKERQLWKSKLESSQMDLSASQSDLKSAKSLLSKAEGNYKATLTDLAATQKKQIQAETQRNDMYWVCGMEALLIVLSALVFVFRKRIWP